MAFRQRIWACTAIMVAGGVTASGLASWSAQVVYQASALWVLSGVLIPMAAAGSLWLGRWWRAAYRAQPGQRRGHLPYAQISSPAVRLEQSLEVLHRRATSARPGLVLLLAILATSGVLLLAGLFSRQAPLIIRWTLGLVLAAGMLLAAESPVVLLSAYGAWCAGAATMGPLRAQQLVMGLLAALLLCAVTHPAPTGGWRAAQLIGGIGLGAGLAMAQQPALAGLVWIAALAGLVDTSRQPQPLAHQLAAGLCALLSGLAIGFWN